MIDFHTPVLEDKPRADVILHNDDVRANDYCFGNLFIWRKKYDTQIAFHEGFLFTRFQSAGKNLYLFPAGKGDLAGAVRTLEKDARLRGGAFTLAGVTPAMREKLDAAFTGKFVHSSSRDLYDYIYTSESLQTLSGRKLHGKRNHIARFKVQGDWNYEEIGEGNMGDCADMNDEWCRLHGCRKDGELGAEYCAVREALHNYDRLGFQGGLLRQNGRVVAFTLGERLCADTFVVHVEKAFSDVEGAYPTINNEFVKHSCADYIYVNREEDLGEEGLRKAKLSYQPAILLEKGHAVLKEGETL